MSPQAEVVTARLRKTWLQWWTFSFWSGVVLAAAVSLATLVLFVLVDALLKLPQRALVSLFAVWAVLSLAAVAALLVRQQRGRRSLAATARRVELAFPELESHLINLVQFAGRDGLETDPFRQAAIAQSAAAVADFPFDQAATRENRWRRFLLCMQTPRDLFESFVLLALVLGLAVLCSAVVPAWGSSTRRILHPFTFVPSVGSVKIVKITPGDTEVLIGSSLQIAAEIDNPAHKPLPATLFVRQADKPESALAMLPDETSGKYVAALSQVLAPLQYRLQIGDTQTQLYKVAVYEKPTVAEVEAAYEFPAYLQRPRETVKQNQGDLEAPQFTRAELKIHPSTPIARGHLMIEGKSIDGQVTDDGKTLVAQLLLKDTTTYTIHLFTAGGHSDPQPRVNQVKVLTDAPPTVQLVEPARETTIAVGTKPNVVVRASDDYGLGQVRIETRDDAPTGEKSGLGVKTVASWTKFAASGVVLEHPLELDPRAIKAGQTVWVRAVAQDRRQLELPELKLGPQESATPWQQIHIVATEAKAKVELAQLESLRTALARILQDQLRAGPPRPVCPGARRRPRPARLPPTSAASSWPCRRPRPPSRNRSGRPRTPSGSRSSAWSASWPSARWSRPSGRPRPCNRSSSCRAGQAVGRAMATQDRIIDVLRRLLNEIRKDTADLLAEMKKRPGTELPSDVQNKLKDLKDKLDEFLKQQKKVIEATENLAKKPVEDFTEKDKQLLKELAATEDEWAKFMADKHTDLSKLPEQDFSNPSLLKELVEVQTELKMAKDALTKKTADIAVPLEQLGAEMAKEMTTNIEKWLPDTPDREKWSQEEPLTDDMKEAPMAELPKELEDIVGELMEDEEDLFDEMEDASSSWADSLDKGAGWDAMDGPISNNSARGVTGNRLPNTSEIAGRSGEGRQGKSSGEFVGDTAVGKGGRNTPSRLTPDAFVKGQVKD